MRSTRLACAAMATCLSPFGVAQVQPIPSQQSKPAAVASPAATAAPAATATTGSGSPDAGPTEPETPQVQRVEITGRAERESAFSPVRAFSARRSSTATKTDTPLIETPQAISVMTRGKMGATGARSVDEALAYVPGAKPSVYGADMPYDWISLRGFDAYAPGFYWDGLLARNAGTWATWRADNYGAERLEVLRGPASTLYGQSGPGGVVNVVSKRPQPVFAAEVLASFGSFATKELAGDVTGPLDEHGQWLYRLTGLARDGGMQFEPARSARQFLAPAVTWRPSAHTFVTFLAHVQRERAGLASGFLPLQGTLLPNPNGPLSPSLLLGEPGFDRWHKDQWAVGWAAETKWGDWTLRQNGRFGELNLDYQQVYGGSFQIQNPADPADPVNWRLFKRKVFGSVERMRSLTLDQQAQWRGTSGSVQHTVLMGVDVQHHRMQRRNVYTAEGPLLDLYAPVYGSPVAVPDPYVDLLTTLKQSGLYLQEQAKVGERWVLTAGLRWDRFGMATSDRLSGNPNRNTGRALTKRLGAVYLLDGGWAPYAGFAESFAPNTVVDPSTGQPFSPEFGKQVEAGLRWQPDDAPHSASLAVFDLKRSGYVTYTPEYTPKQNGTVHVRGLELEANLEPQPGTRLTAAYTFMPRAIVVASANPAEIGKQQQAIARHQLSAWADHQWAAWPGLRTGLGLRHSGATRGTDESSPIPIPAWTAVDAMLGYSWGRFELTVHGRNLANRVPVVNVAGPGAYWGSARHITASLKARFE